MKAISTTVKRELASMPVTTVKRDNSVKIIIVTVVTVAALITAACLTFGVTVN